MIKSWDDFMDAVAALPRPAQIHARQVFDQILDKEYTARQLQCLGIPCLITGAENPKG
jgi:hypothetical protein